MDASLSRLTSLGDIESEIARKEEELSKLAPHLDTEEGLIKELKQIAASTKSSLLKLVQGDYSEFPENEIIHAAKSFSQLFGVCYMMLKGQSTELKGDSLKNEVEALAEQTVEDFTLERRFIDEKFEKIVSSPEAFADLLWNDLLLIIETLLRMKCEDYPYILGNMGKLPRDFFDFKKKATTDWATDYLGMEKLNSYTCNPYYETSLSSLLGQKMKFVEAVRDSDGPPQFTIEGLEETVDVTYLRRYISELVEKAFVLKMKVAAYWNVVLVRFVDAFAVHTYSSIYHAVHCDIAEQDIEHNLYNFLFKAIRGPDGKFALPVRSAKRIQLEESLATLQRLMG